MRNLKSSLPMKITAVILSYVMVFILVLSVASVAFMGYFDFYVNSAEKLERNILGSMAKSDCYMLAGYVDLERENIPYYFEDSNVYFSIEKANGENILTTYAGEKIITAEQYYTEDEIFTIYIADEMTKTDKYSVIRNLVQTGHKLRYVMVFFVLFSLIVFIVLLCYLYSSAGHNDAYSYIKLNALDKIPFDIYTLFVAFCLFMGLNLIFDFYYEGLEFLLVLFFVGTAAYFLLLGFTMTFATRVKTSTLFKNTVIYKILSILCKYFKNALKFAAYHLKRLPLVWRVFLELAVILFFESIFFMFNLYQVENLVIGFILINFLFLAVVLYTAITLQRIKKGGEQIASGDLDYKINTDYMVLDFKNFAENLNNINDGMQTAINEKMRSERFKTELITNVSHDIKTPLTSIINYVDLLKKEDIKNPNAKEYISVLDRHSERLKKLVEDLVEASKASTGNIAVNLEDCDVGVLLSQALGEFDERFEKSGITPILKIASNSVIIKADARHLWRVFDNLLSNICKYSQQGTRAYIDACVKDKKAVISFRNISSYELNVSSQELMERFVRGDKSRNTEGSGLGLSIARSLIELQNGTINIEVDGDLFKAVLEFDV